MDTSRFDALVKSLRNVGSRRRLLGVLAALPVGGLLASLGDDVTDARNKGQGRKRRHRPGKHKKNRKGKRKHTPVGDQPDCAGVLTRGGCTQVFDQQLGRNKWRCQPTLSLKGADLSGCNLEYAEMTGVQLQNAFMNRANLNNAVLKRARLDGATMDSVTAVNARFDLAILYKASLADGDLRNVNFDQADIRLRDWRRTVCPNGRRISGTHPTCCNDLSGPAAKYCGYA